jgi:deazaflavin-dependent oxidoreductase (nitroreductase family)
MVTMKKPQSTATTPSAPTAQVLLKAPARMKAKDAFYKVDTGVHRAVFNASKERIFGETFGMPIVELVTTGRRSGKERSTMLAVPIADGDCLVLLASFGGDDRHPEWYPNHQADPEVRATIAGSTRTMIARTATEEERTLASDHLGFRGLRPLPGADRTADSGDHPRTQDSSAGAGRVSENRASTRSKLRPAAVSAWLRRTFPQPQ